MAKKSFGFDKTPILDQRPTAEIFSEETLATAAKVVVQKTEENKQALEKNERVSAEEQEKPKTGFVIRPRKKVEVKSKQLHLILKPSIYKALKITAKNNQCSMNDLVSELIETYCIVEE